MCMYESLLSKFFADIVVIVGLVVGWLYVFVFVHLNPCTIQQLQEINISTTTSKFCILSQVIRDMEIIFL